MIETFKAVDDYNNGQEYTVCKLTESGENWILSNQDQLQFRSAKQDNGNVNDLPF